MGEGGQVTALSRAEAASLLGWWLDAGVDVGISEEPRNWLTAAKPLPLAGREEARSAEGKGLSPARSEQALLHQRVEQPPAVQGQSGGLTDPLILPQAGGEFGGGVPQAGGEKKAATLDAFHAWLAESASLPLFRAGAARALPHGPAEPEIMLLTGIPAAEDAAEGKPLGGAALVLAQRMLAAIGLTGEQAYAASMTCFDGAGSRLSASEAEGCREQLLHHIGLVAPRRLLLLGDEPARLLLGLRLTQARGKVHRIGGVPAVVTFHPRHLLGRSADKALAWRDLLLLMGEPT